MTLRVLVACEFSGIVISFSLGSTVSEITVTDPASFAIALAGLAFILAFLCIGLYGLGTRER